MATGTAMDTISVVCIGERFRDALGLVVQEEDLDALHLGGLADTLDFGERAFPYVHQVGAVFLEDTDPDRVLAVEVPRIGSLLAVVADFRNVAEPQSLVGDDQVADFLDASEFTFGIDAVACLVVADQACGIRKIHLPQLALQVHEVDSMRHHAVGDEFDANLVRLDALEVDPRDAGDTLQRPHQLPHQHVVGAREVALAGDPQPQDRLVGQVELEDVDAAHVGRQLVADSFHALTGLDRLDGHVFTPVEDDLDVRATL
jgi:hypothetical protein